MLDFVEREIPTVKASRSSKKSKEEKHLLCSVVLTKGKRKGLNCERKILQDTDKFCKFHSGKSVEKEICTVVLTKGERKNQPCNRKVAEDSKLCKIHQSVEDKRPYNPYVDKESDATINGNSVTSAICNLDLDLLNRVEM